MQCSDAYVNSRESKKEAFAIAIKKAENTIVGDPKGDNTTIGPLVSDIQFDKVQTLIDTGISEGATLLVGGTGKPEGLNKGYYVKPTVFGDVTNDMTIAREEIFGPVLSIITYSDIDEAVSIANDSEYGLAAYVAGENKEDLTAIASDLRAGQIHITMALAAQMLRLVDTNSLETAERKPNGDLKNFLK